MRRRLQPLPAIAGWLLAAALATGPAHAQVKAPRLFDDNAPLDEEPAPPPRERPPGPARPPGTADAGPAPAASAAPAQPSPSALPGVSISAEELRSLQRPIEPVRATYAAIRERWQARREAVRDQSPAAAQEARRQILSAMQELGIENLRPFGAAEVRDAERALGTRSPDDALEHASFAAELAPDLPEAHLAVARALLAGQPRSFGGAARAFGRAVAAALREPHTLRAFYGDLWSAGLAALFAAAAVSLLALLGRHLRLFLHDFPHLPLVRAGSRSQAMLLALVLLALPVALGLGPMAFLAAAAAAVWLYLSRAERAVATAAVLALASLPVLAEVAARTTVWTGTLAADVYELEHGFDAGGLAERVEARAAAGKAPAAALAALGRHYKRAGRLAEALRWYRSAAEADPRSGMVQVNLGNALFLEGDLDGAKAAYQAAVERAGSVTTLAAAHYNLSKLYLRLAAVEQQTEARKKALAQDQEFVEAHGSDDDFRANRWLIDVPLPLSRIAELTRPDPSPHAVGEAVRARLAPGIGGSAWPWVPLAVLALLWLAVPLASRLGPSRACARCGRPACGRCDGVPGDACGQCVNVFERRSGVEARDRARKEVEVRRYARRRQALVRALGLAGGGLGHLFGGWPVRGFLFLLALFFPAFVIWFWRGVLPPPQPSPYAAAGKLAVAVPAAVALYALAVRDLFRRVRE